MTHPAPKKLSDVLPGLDEFLTFVELTPGVSVGTLAQDFVKLRGLPEAEAPRLVYGFFCKTVPKWSLEADSDLWRAAVHRLCQQPPMIDDAPS